MLLPILLFLTIELPHIFLIPSGDGNVEFKLAYLMYHGEYFSHWSTFHPPVKLLLFNIFFYVLGYPSFTLLGIVVGMLGIYALYLIGEKLFDKKVALLSAFLLAISGLYLSVAISGLNDFIMTVIFLFAFVFYTRSRYWLYALFASLAILTKETAAVMALGILITELFQQKKRLIPLLIPCLFLGIWWGFLTATGHHLWNDYNFSATKQYGSVHTILFNLLTFGFLNKFAYENWLHLFVFNFNWVYTTFAIIGLFSLKDLLKRKEFLAIGISSFLFCLLVLSFQTWTINRYILPILPFLYLFASYAAVKVNYKYTSVLLLIVIAYISMTTSIDPVSNLIWPKTNIFDEQFYLIKSDGGDGITYNLQYLTVMQKRTDMLTNNRCNMPYLLSYDKKTLAAFNIKTCR